MYNNDYFEKFFNKEKDKGVNTYKEKIEDLSLIPESLSETCVDTIYEGEEETQVKKTQEKRNNTELKEPSKKSRTNKRIARYKWYKKKLAENAERNLPVDIVVYRLVYKVSRNNVYILVFDPMNKPIFYSSGGLKYSQLRRESLPTVNILLGENLGKRLIQSNVFCVDLEFQGFAYKENRVNFWKGLTEYGLLIRNIWDKTPISHNGCRRKKKRRTSRRKKLL